MRARLEDVCERGSSNLRQADVAGRSGDYPIYGASGYIGNVDFYHQEKPYVAVVKDGAGIGRTTLLPAKSSVIGTMQYLLPKDNVLPEYLSYVVQYMHLEKYFSGATIPHIYYRDYKNEEFNLDCIEKQTEIVGVLIRTEGIIAARQQQLQKLDELVKARLYVAYFMESPAGKEQFESKNQSAVKAGLNFNSINSLRLMVPPLEEQNAFVNFVEQTDKSKVAVQKALDETQLLFDSLMQKYFR